MIGYRNTLERAIDFLDDRLNEEEAIAREAIPETVRGYGDESRRYVMRFTPDRTLAEIAAKRAVIELCYIMDFYGHDVVGFLISVYKDHPGFEPEWLNMN